jgi:putative endonuclease
VDSVNRTGVLGEELAARYLAGAGLQLLDRNWRCRRGELDVVARDGDALVFVEVKTRTSLRFGTPLEAVDARKALRLRRLAALWLRAHPTAGSSRPRVLRFDVVAVTALPGRGPQLQHVRDVLPG